MKKNIVIIILIALVFCLTSLLTKAVQNNDTDIENEPTISKLEIVAPVVTEPEATEIVLDIIEVEIAEPMNLEEANAVLDGITIRLTNAVELLNILNSFGYPQDHPAIVLAQTEITNAENNFQHYSQIQQEFEIKYKWEVRKNEYPIATEIWLYLKNLGYNDWVCAGIIGNMMTETGGQTLDIKYNIYSKDNAYYGICQWSHYYDIIWGANLQSQCDFLAQTIQYEINNFGYIYRKGFSFNDFLNLNNEKEAALAFAKTYERCSSSSYLIRQTNATIAYEYFTN